MNDTDNARRDHSSDNVDHTAEQVLIDHQSDDALRATLAKAIADYQACGHCEGDCRACLEEADALLPVIRDHIAADSPQRLFGRLISTAKGREILDENGIRGVERAETAEAEVKRLTDWKESAMTVMSGLQDLGQELGLPVGESITGTFAAETAHKLRERAEHWKSRAENAWAREDDQALVAYQKHRAETVIERVRAICNAVEYKDPGRPDTYTSYAEGRHDLAAEVLAVINETQATP